MAKQANPAKRRLKHRPHTIERLKERYGIEVNRKEYGELLRAIKTGPPTSKSLGRLSYKATVHAVEFKGQTLILLYNSNDKRIATAMPPDYQLPQKKGERVIL